VSPQATEREVPTAQTASPSGRYATTSPARGQDFYYFTRFQTCVLHSGATMQPFSFS
jgi:hypothetical protein